MSDSELTERLDELADVAGHWKRNRDKGVTPHTIRAALLTLAKEVVDTQAAGSLLSEGKSCVWREDWDSGWNTGCGQRFELNEGAPAENDMRFCPYCGKPLEQHRYVVPAVE